MPTSQQLSNPPSPVDGDGSTTETRDDGGSSVSWPDGTTRENYPDGSAMITFTDGAILNLYADGTKALNDASGHQLDPTTGQPLSSPDAPTPPDLGPDRLLRLMKGDEKVADLNEAKTMFDAFKDALEGDLDPVELIKVVIESALSVVKAVGTEERGCYMRAWSYGLVYGALDMGVPPEPTFSGSLGGPDQDVLDKQYWSQGVDAAVAALADGTNGVSTRNKILLRVARDGSQPATAVTELWQAACVRTGDDGNAGLAAAYPSLSWPEPTGA